MVRDLLQNRVYTGRVPYCETLYSGSLGEGKRSSRNRKQWFEGKHEGFISDTLFDECQEVSNFIATIVGGVTNAIIFLASLLYRYL